MSAFLVDAGYLDEKQENPYGIPLEKVLVESGTACDHQLDCNGGECYPATLPSSRNTLHSRETVLVPRGYPGRGISQDVNGKEH